MFLGTKPPSPGVLWIWWRVFLMNLFIIHKNVMPNSTRDWVLTVEEKLGSTVYSLHYTEQSNIVTLTLTSWASCFKVICGLHGYYKYCLMGDLKSPDSWTHEHVKVCRSYCTRMIEEYSEVKHFHFSRTTHEAVCERLSNASWSPLML